MRIISIIIGITAAAIGGVIAYRSYFFDASGFTLSVAGAEQASSDVWIAAGLVMVLIGIVTAFVAATRKSRYTGTIPLKNFREWHN